MTHPVRAYALATLTPVILIAVGALAQGAWVWAALLYMTLFTFALDQLIGTRDPEEDPGRALPAADALSVTLALSHLALLPLVVWSLSTPGPGLGERVGLFFAAALFFGQVSNSNAHELIHRGDKRL